MGWRNLSKTAEKSSSSPRAELRREIVFGVTYKLRVKDKIVSKNRYSEGRNDRQMTPGGYPNLNSYLKNLRVLKFITDGWTDRDIHSLRVGWRNFFSSFAVVSVFGFWQEIGFGVTNLIELYTDSVFLVGIRSAFLGIYQTNTRGKLGQYISFFFLVGTPFFLKRGVMAPFLRGLASILRKKGFPAKPEQLNRYGHIWPMHRFSWASFKVNNFSNFCPLTTFDSSKCS